MNLMYIYMSCVVAYVGSISAIPHITVSAHVGSSVILPCELTKVFTQTPVVQWRTNNAVVFERSSDGTDVGSGYEGRVDVPEDELHKRNCSLVFKNIGVADEGDYNSFVVDKANTWKEIIRVTLKVYDKPVRRSNKMSATPAKLRSIETSVSPGYTGGSRYYSSILLILPILVLLGFGIKKLVKKVVGG